jgi:hypothetical protein
MICFQTVDKKVINASEILDVSALNDANLANLVDKHPNMVVVNKEGESPIIINLDNIIDIWEIKF